MERVALVQAVTETGHVSRGAHTGGREGDTLALTATAAAAAASHPLNLTTSPSGAFSDVHLAEEAGLTACCEFILVLVPRFCFFLPESIYC